MSLPGIGTNIVETFSKRGAHFLSLGWGEKISELKTAHQVHGYLLNPMQTGTREPAHALLSEAPWAVKAACLYLWFRSSSWSEPGAERGQGSLSLAKVECVVAFACEPFASAVRARIGSQCLSTSFKAILWLYYRCESLGVESTCLKFCLRRERLRSLQGHQCALLQPASCWGAWHTHLASYGLVGPWYAAQYAAPMKL